MPTVSDFSLGPHVHIEKLRRQLPCNHQQRPSGDQLATNQVHRSVAYHVTAFLSTPHQVRCSAVRMLTGVAPELILLSPRSMKKPPSKRRGPGAQ